MANVTLRLVKGSPLTNSEVDNNFSNLNIFKVEIGGDLSGNVFTPIVSGIRQRAVADIAPANGQALIWISANSAWEPGNVATSGGITGPYVANLLAGNGITITGLIGVNATPNISITNTGVTAGSYGNATLVPSIIVDAQGRITSATNVSIFPASNVTLNNATINGTLTIGNTFIEETIISSISASSITFDLSSSTVFEVTLNSAITTMNITNPAPSGRVSSFTLVFTYTGTSYSVTWNAAIKWPGGIAPTLTNTNNKKDVFVFFTTDGGTSYNAFIAGQNI